MTLCTVYVSKTNMNRFLNRFPYSLFLHFNGFYAYLKERRVVARTHFDPYEIPYKAKTIVAAYHKQIHCLGYVYVIYYNVVLLSSILRFR